MSAHLVQSEQTAALRRAVLVVALLNLSYFGVEFGVALRIGSVALFADSIDFLEDAALNLIILVALGWSARRRSLVGTLLAGILLVPVVATGWSLWQKIVAPTAPEPIALTLVGLGALIINLTCALMLTRFRSHRGSLTRAAFLSARNDAFANIAIIVAGLLTLATVSIWPDVVVGVGIALLNIGAAREVAAAARAERQTVALDEPAA